MTDLIRRADAIEAVKKLKIVEDNKNYPDYAYNAGIETAIKTIEVMLSADAEEYIKECNTKTHDLVHRDVITPKLVDCTDFVNWLIEEVMDDEMWELNAVGNGEIICRKLKKLGLLEVKDGYYIRRSAEAVQGDGRNNLKRYPNCQMRTSLGNCDAIGGFCTSINAPICDAFHKLSEAVQGEWIDTGNWMGIECSRCKCHSRYVTPFCPQCGAKMKGGAE